MAYTQNFFPQHFWAPVLTTSILIALCPITYCVYNVFFHRLSKFPGPVLWRATRLPYMRAAWSGQFPYIVQNLHKRYGEVVRIAPNELSFANPAAWEDIYSNRGNHSAFPKSETWHGSPPPSSVFSKIDFKEHARVRRAMDPGFTERAVLRQESIIQAYLDKFVERLRKRILANDDESTVVNIIEWFNFVVFDIIGDLGFGESFHCLEDVKYHEWMSFMFNSIKANYLIISLGHYPLLFRFLMRLIPESARKKQKEHRRLAVEKADRRLSSTVERPDIISLMERQSENSKEGLSLGEIHANASLLIIAGSETTVTVLTGITNHLLQNPTSLAKLTNELRGGFGNTRAMSFTAVKQLSYLNAVINEGLRMCNPNPIGHMRISPPQGGNVAGHFVAGNTLVTIHPTTLMFSDEYFHEPYAWRPERWLDDAKTNPSSPYFNDDRKCVRAFGHGPQSCIGIPLAWAEMRIILARLLWAFDLSKADTPHAEVKWETQKVFGVLDKHPLDVKLAKRLQ